MLIELYPFPNELPITAIPFPTKVALEAYPFPATSPGGA